MTKAIKEAEAAGRLRAANGTFSLINASDASTVVQGRSGSSAGGESLVLDTLENFDGLERLIVIGVSLDAPLNEGAEDMLETRSRLYRALTRAHMMALVVNETVPGGWLEWLNTVRLKADAKFNRKAEMERLKADAAELVVAKRVEEVKAGLKAALQKHKLEAQKSFKLSDDEDRLLRRRIDSDKLHGCPPDP
jgi:hypothetical protein